MQPGERKVVQRNTYAGNTNSHWVDGAVQTLFGEQGVSAGKTLFGGKQESRETIHFEKLATDLLLIAVKIPEMRDLGRPQDLQKLLHSYFKEFERACILARKASNQVELVKYALTALIDEFIINSSGECHDFWVSEPLQVKYFNDHLAGQNFFVRLEEILKEPRKNIEIIELFYLCLVLGFQGRYRLQGSEKLPLILRNLMKKIESVKGPAPRALSPSANVHPGKKGKERTGRLWILSASALLAFSFVVYFGLMALSSAPLKPAKDVVERMNERTRP